MHPIMSRRSRVLLIIATILPLVGFAASAQADIFQWEYINPVDPSQGKRQSTTLAPDGAGVDAVPGADLSFRNLTMAYLIGADLTGATLTDADFANAEIRGAALRRVITSTGPRGTGVTLAQLYSTASYQDHDLTGINLSQTNVAGGNFAGQNLTNANFDMAWLVDADFSGAEVRGANFGVVHRGQGGVWLGSGITRPQLYSTASYQAKDLHGVHLDNNVLDGADFAGHNLTSADFTGTWLNDADFTGAEIRGASFARGDFGTGISGSQLYSTASYQAKDLRGVRGLSGLSLPGPLTTNLILPSGRISGLHLEGDGLVIRDYDGDARYSSTQPLPITIDQHFTMAHGGTLRMVFEADAWDSTISFAPGIPVTLGGTLELTFAADVNPATQVGRTFDLFNWESVSPTGAFEVSSPYRWNLSNLYTTGEVTLTAVPEPASIALAAAVVGMILLRRRPSTCRLNHHKVPIQLVSELITPQPCLNSRSAALRKLTASRATVVLISVAAAAFLIPQSAAHSAVRTVALSGQPAPGTPEGVNYSSFGAHFLTTIARQTYRGPVINNAGQVAFRANLAGSGIDATNNQGIWSEGAGSLAMVARTGNMAPGVPGGVNFGLNYALELFEPVLNNAGQTAFYGGLTDGTVGLWSEGSGNLAIVARDGTPAPGTSDGVNLSFAVLRDFFPGLPKLNDAGQVAFLANVTGAGIDNTNDWGVWSERTGGLGLVARSGNPAPGTPDGVNFDSFFFQSGFNNAGQSALFAFVTGEGVDPSNDQGIWSEGPGGLALVARSGMPAPGTPSGVNFRDFIFATVAFNSMGRTTFKGFLTGEGVDDSNDEGIWSESSGTLALVARRGSPAPGTPSGVNFDEFAVRPALCDAGQSAFSATLTGTGVTSANSQGIWLGDDEELTLVARTGNQAPGTPAGVKFSNLGRQTVNSAGQIAFRAGLTGAGVGTANNLGIWATDQDGALQLIARTGSQVEIAPGVFRTTSDLGIALDSGNSDGRASAFNDLGQLVFWVSFTNGTQGVFVSDLVKIPVSQTGDFDGDGDVDGPDFLAWQRGESPNPLSADDLADWQANYGFVPDPLIETTAIPEPVTLTLCALAIATLLRRLKSHVRPGLAVLFVAGGVALSSIMSVPAQGATIGFDASAISTAVVPFDPDGLVEARGNYVSGRVPTDVKGPVRGGTNINSLVGADAFYSQGYTGTNAVIANIESGHVWNGHETLQHVLQIPNHPQSLNEIDRHPTWVASIIGGRQGGANPGPYQEGIAPDAQLYSGAVASQWNGPRFTQAFNFANESVFDQYRKAFSSGVNLAGRRADVINSSWGGDEGANGSDTLSIALDGFANANPRTLFVVSAGNDGPGPNTVFSPASAYNNMSVAALGPNLPYDRPASFSSGGPNNYRDPVNGTVNNARPVVDIAAPGEMLSSAYYGGETGGNGTTDNPSESGLGPTGLPAGPLGGADYYTRGGLSGTSFAAPTVAGGAALLYDAAYSLLSSNDDARDARVMKAVLMNSADKTIGWNNGQVAHPNGLGGVLTTQGLDNRVGVGRMNLHSAYGQFLEGATDVAGTSSGNIGLVENIGWDFGQVVSGVTNDYYFASPLAGGSSLTATLTWFRDRRINASNAVFDDSFDDLNLELWSVVDGAPASLISESSSLYNESEHFSFALPATGEYALRVRWFKEGFDVVADANQEMYGLAWWAGTGLNTLLIPEPAALLLALAALALTPRRAAR
jgi:uncharacterized protein YjbI with pentapeptide repeats